MSVFGLFDIGRTTLLTTRRALDTTAHNVANSATPGYSRQDVVLQSIPTGTVSGVGTTGRGVRLTEVRRMYDAFISNQLTTEKSTLSYWDGYQKGVSKIESLFNEAGDTGISPAITDFFNAWQEVSQNPEGSAQRTLLIKKGEYLSSRISRAFTSLYDEKSDLLKSSQSLSVELNSTTAQIADLNEKIAISPGALDLRDQRDALLERLNEIVKVTTFEDNVGRYSVLINGTPLVDGGKVFKMSVSTDTSDKMSFFVNLPNEMRDVTSSITGGELKANIDLRESKITAYMNKLNAFALGMSLTINEYHKAGYGLDGSTGNNFFRDVTPPFVTNDSNTAAGAAISDTNVTIDNLDRVNFEKQYAIDYNNTGGTGYQQEGATGIFWRIQESTDGTNWSTVNTTNINMDTTAANTRTFQFEGINVKIDGAPAVLLATAPNFETFTVSPNPDAARNMGVAISDFNKVAAAAGDLNTQYTVKAGINDQIMVNGGPITLTAGSYNRFELAAELQTQLNGALGANASTVTFDAGKSKFKIINNTAAAVTINWTADPVPANAQTTAEDLFGFVTDSTIQPGSYVEGDAEIKGGTIVMNSSNNALSFSEDGGTTYVTAVIPQGTYTRNELSTVLKTALEGADTATAFTYNVSYNPAAKTYTISNNGGNPSNVILDWTNTATTAEGIFGYGANSLISAGASATSTAALYPILPGDNANAKFIANLSGQTIMSGSSPVDYYRSIVSDVGVEASSAKQIQKFQTTMVDELERRRQELSGVNLDEEAANLVKYQKSFEAAAKMISVANELLDTLLKMT